MTETEAMRSWAPIETAPKDGTVILFFTPGPDARYHISRADDRWAGAHWLREATHWMPLPAPPTAPHSAKTSSDQ